MFRTQSLGKWKFDDHIAKTLKSVNVSLSHGGLACTWCKVRDMGVVRGAILLFSSARASNPALILQIEKNPPCFCVASRKNESVHSLLMLLMWKWIGCAFNLDPWCRIYCRSFEIFMADLSLPPEWQVIQRSYLMWSRDNPSEHGQLAGRRCA